MTHRVDFLVKSRIYCHKVELGLSEPSLEPFHLAMHVDTLRRFDVNFIFPISILHSLPTQLIHDIRQHGVDIMENLYVVMNDNSDIMIYIALKRIMTIDSFINAVNFGTGDDQEILQSFLGMLKSELRESQLGWCKVNCCSQIPFITKEDEFDPLLIDFLLLQSIKHYSACFEDVYHQYFDASL